MGVILVGTRRRYGREQGAMIGARARSATVKVTPRDP